MNKLGSAFGKMAAGLGVLASVEATAQSTPEPQPVNFNGHLEPIVEGNPTLEQVDKTYQGVEDCVAHLRPIVMASQDTEIPITRAEAGQMIAECRNAQLQATLAEQEATLAEQEATLAALNQVIAEQERALEQVNADLAAKGLKIEGDNLLSLDGDLLGHFSTQGGQIKIDLTPWQERSELLAAEAQEALADFEQFLMDSLSNQP